MFPKTDTVLVIAPEETMSKTSLTLVFFYHIRDNFILVVAGLNRSILIPVVRICDNVWRAVLGGEDVVMIMPQSTFTFIITVLLALTEIKSQGKTGFPFQTHPKSIMVSVTSVVVYGFASAVEYVFSAIGFHRDSVYTIIARLGRICSLYILVASLACLFYF